MGEIVKRAKLGPFVSVISVLAGTVAVTSCKDTMVSGPGVETSGGVATIAGNPTPGNVSTDGFWVKPYFDPAHPEDVYSYYLHEQSKPFSADNCFVDPSNASLTGTSGVNDLYCYFDVAEYDLYFNGVTFVFNAPSSMCQYTTLKPYDFYDYRAGYFNPPTATVHLGVGGGLISAVPGLGGAAGLPYNANFTSMSCPFDYSAGGGPNCCVGSYEIDVTQDAATGPPTQTVVKANFGGSISNCILGPGKDFAVDVNGFPEGVVYRTLSNGQSLKYTVVPAANSPGKSGKGYSTNVYLANFWDPSLAVFGSGSSTFPAPVANWPTALTGTLPAAGTVGLNYMTAAPNLDPYYTYSCRDQAGDILARMRIMIRSWDTVANFTATSNPYTNPLTLQPGFNKSFHDAGVWEDYGTNYPNSDTP